MVLALVAAAYFACLVDSAYLARDAEALYRLHDRAVTREDSLLVRYRLYPLTENPHLLSHLPDPSPDASAREVVLLSALWAFRMDDAGVVHKLQYAQRTMQYLDAAVRLAPDDPFVQLIEGQSLLYRPRWAGGGPERAIARFESLHRSLIAADRCIISTAEVEVWLWFAAHKFEHEDADALRSALLGRQLPPLLRQFVLEPPA